MIRSIDSSDLEQFRVTVLRCLGLHFDDSRLGLLADALHQRLDARRLSPSGYLGRLQERIFLREELHVLAQELTVGETYFFRNHEQFYAFEEVVLGGRLSTRSYSPQLRVLSVGCSSGEEPYSLAICVRETLGSRAVEVVIHAVDVNPVAVKKAAHARYAAWALRDTPPEVRKRWFRVAGRDFVLDETIRNAVKFEVRNVMEDNADLWQPGLYDVVFCRNVIMYFSPEKAHTLIHRITQSLCPGGYLFLGHAETLRGLSHDYRLFHTHGTFYYQRKAALEEPSAAMFPDMATALHPHTIESGSTVTCAESWVETVQRAADRIHILAGKVGLMSRTAAEMAGQVAPSSTVPGIDIGFVLELLKKERFVEALAHLDRVSMDTIRDADTLLLRATLLAHSGRLAEAETVSTELLEYDATNAGAHYVLALCREGQGDRVGALNHDQVATYLDPSFAMPRLHLGLMEQRVGDVASARRDLHKALQLLAGEDASRLLLFGGGFGREGLMALCRSELLVQGGQA